MPIPSTRYVLITSGVAGASAVVQRKLVGLRFSTDPRVPADAQLEFSNARLVSEFFGDSAPETQFANQYFAYISPPPASAPESLKFAAYSPSGRAPTIFGGSLQSSLAQLQSITAGTFNITIGTNVAALTGLNFSTAVTLQDVGTILQTALRLVTGFESSTVTYEPLNLRYVLTSAVIAEGEVSGVSGTAAVAMSFTEEDAIISQGMDPQSPLQAFQRAEDVSDSFGTSSFPGDIAVISAVPLAQYIAGLNIKYQHYWSVSPSTYEDFTAAMINTASNGLILNNTAGQFKEALPMAVAAAVDYDRRNAVVNFMFRSPSITLTSDVTTEALANQYDLARVNYYGQTAMFGQRIDFFQRGYLCGNPATAPVDMGVHLNEQWLKSAAATNFMNLLLVKGIVPANQDGRGYGMAIINELAQQGKFNGTIIAGKEMTSTQIGEIASISGDDKAHFDVFNMGYWADAQIIRQTGPSNITEYVLQYTLIYSANVGVRKVEGSHNLIV